MIGFGTVGRIDTPPVLWTARSGACAHAGLGRGQERGVYVETTPQAQPPVPALFQLKFRFEKDLD